MASFSLFQSGSLFAFTRKSIPEIVVPGVTLFKPHNATLHQPEQHLACVSRTLLKPWQFLAADVFGPEGFWSMGLATHSGQPMHLDALMKLREAAGAEENDLICPRAFPLDALAAAHLRVFGEQQSRFHHPCAGKHLMMIAACARHGFSADHYWDVDHPLQRKVLNLVGRESGEKLTWVTDSCGLPVAAMTMRSLMFMWEKLALSEEPRVQQLRALWLDNVRLIGGQRRLDSDIIEAMGRRVIAKEGADGLLMVQSLPGHGGPVATCLVKIASGYQPSYLALALWALLSRTSGLPPVFSDLTDYLRSRLEEWVPRDQELLIPPFSQPH